MAHQIVATSVPRGLDGVSGYQTVLKSQGIPPRVFERLKARSGYSHRYPHGDPRNPVVYVHRIEELAGGRWHVLGCIRDAGSDHTGRSNFLAHMLGIDAAEARGKPGGPAAAAQARGCFLEKWDAPPEPAAAAKTLIAADRQPRPGEARAWTAVGLDPGLAGDLAAAAMANKKILLITRPGDDVLAMFADALSLVEPSKRWDVTFNTCAIEDFDGTWKAVRADLGDARNLRDGKATLIDLTGKPRGSDGPYAQFARGATDALPWLQTEKPPETSDDPEDAVVSEEKTTADDRSTRRRLTTKKGPKVAAGPRARERPPKYAEEEPSRVPWNVILPVGISLLLVGVLAAIPFRDQLFNWADAPPRSPVLPEPQAGGTSIAVPNPAPRDSRDTPEYQRATALKEAKDRLLAGVNGKTHQQLREEAEALRRKIDDLRRGTAQQTPLFIRRSGTGDDNKLDPRPDIKPVIAACDRVRGILETATGLALTDVRQAESEFQRAVDKLAKLEREVDELAEKERAYLVKQEMKRQAEQKRKRQKEAFQNFQSLSKAVSLPTAATQSGIDVELGSKTNSTTTADATVIDLGPFSIADLVNPQLQLAVPRDKVEGGDFTAEVAPVDGQDGAWEIRFLPQGEGLEGGSRAPAPRKLAGLIERNGRLTLEVPRSNELRRAPFALLRRSVILIEAKDPDTDSALPMVQAIRLVEPTRVPPLVIDLFAEDRQELKIPVPPGDPRCMIPVASVRLEAEFPGIGRVNIELPKDVQEGTDPGIGRWECPLVQLVPQLGPQLGIQAVVKLSLPQATLAVETEFTGPQARIVKKDRVKEFFIDKPEKSLGNFKRGFRQIVTTGEQFSPNDMGKIGDWFRKTLVDSSMNMPGHETIASSFELFLKERYDAAARNMQPPKKPDLPSDGTEFLKRCTEVKTIKQWQDVYTDRISAWASWFLSQFEKRWKENVELFQGAVGEQHEIRIIAITSLAYDKDGTEYEVPLVILGDPPAESAEPEIPAAAGKSIGID